MNFLFLFPETISTSNNMSFISTFFLYQLVLVHYVRRSLSVWLEKWFFLKPGTVLSSLPSEHLGYDSASSQVDLGRIYFFLVLINYVFTAWKETWFVFDKRKLWNLRMCFRLLFLQNTWFMMHLSSSINTSVFINTHSWVLTTATSTLRLEPWLSLWSRECPSPEHVLSFSLPRES